MQQLQHNRQVYCLQGSTVPLSNYKFSVFEISLLQTMECTLWQLTQPQRQSLGAFPPLQQRLELRGVCEQFAVSLPQLGFEPRRNVRVASGYVRSEMKAQHEWVCLPNLPSGLPVHVFTQETFQSYEKVNKCVWPHFFMIASQTMLVLRRACDGE